MNGKMKFRQYNTLGDILLMFWRICALKFIQCGSIIHPQNYMKISKKHMEILFKNTLSNIPNSL